MIVVKWINEFVVSQHPVQLGSQDATTAPAPAAALAAAAHGTTNAATVNHPGRVSQAGPVSGAAAAAATAGNAPTKPTDLRNPSLLLTSSMPLPLLAQQQQQQQQNKQVVKRKVVEVEPEPKYVKSDESTSPLELLINANCDYSRYRCRVNSIRFRDTLMFQTRIYE